MKKVIGLNIDNLFVIFGVWGPPGGSLEGGNQKSGQNLSGLKPFWKVILTFFRCFYEGVFSCIFPGQAIRARFLVVL